MQWLRVRRQSGWRGTGRSSWPIPTGSTATSIVIACRVDQHRCAAALGVARMNGGREEVVHPVP